MSFMVTATKEDWKTRDYIEDVSLCILQVTEFLNKFEKNMRVKLLELNEKLNDLERKMQYVEAAVNSIEQNSH
ncbi:hypothetical protein C9374_008949 [Naegleria lovaniensis]|uniref:Uncharacterized protein n=1 Tax=Naegleria lovaniensis TaxID=51637 RepID=A0AA88KKJ2_NAELO|nr:uncharacterized protein C9374_008949 [Naegleria lovaniensis]KAG2377864.1 hypothetical protein C9374_008949 [Naegleria lovaniensis]